MEIFGIFLFHMVIALNQLKLIEFHLVGIFFCVLTLMMRIGRFYHNYCSDTHQICRYECMNVPEKEKKKKQWALNIKVKPELLCTLNLVVSRKPWPQIVHLYFCLCSIEWNFICRCSAVLLADTRPQMLQVSGFWICLVRICSRNECLFLDLKGNTLEYQQLRWIENREQSKCRKNLIPFLADITL